MSSAIDVAVAAALASLDDGADDGARVHRPPYIAAIPVRALFADVTYQREQNRARVDEMAAQFDPTLLGVVEVSLRTGAELGQYAVLDGQHRVAAARRAMGPAHPMVCQVHSGLTPADEARVFYEIDRRRRALSGWDRWKARRGAGDPLVVEIEAIAAQFRLVIDPAPRPGNLAATIALEKVMRLGGRPLLTSTLSFLTAAYRTNRAAYDGTVIQGLALVLHHYRVDVEVSPDRLTAALQSIAPKQLKARAAAMREITAGETTKLVGAVIIRAYNDQPGRNVQPFLDRIKPHGKFKPASRDDG